MASNRVSAVLFRVIIAALLLFTASYPQAHAQFLGGLSPLPPLIPSQLPVGLNVSGQVCCAPNGNCPVEGGGQGVGGVPVALNCIFRDGTITLVGGTTSGSGMFSFITFVPAVGQLVSSFLTTGLIPCVIVINHDALLSAIACPVLSTLNATLVSLVKVTGTAANAVIGTLVNATITGFVSATV